MSTKAEKRNFLVEIETGLGFQYDTTTKRYSKYYSDIDASLEVDAENERLIYPEDKGFIVNDRTTSNFEKAENFVVFECVDRLFTKGYRPESVELEPKWTLGHEDKGGKADICVKDTNGVDILAMIECKTFGTEYNKELAKTESDGGQLFSYWQQDKSTKWLSLYASFFNKSKVEYVTESIDCSDDANILALAKKDASIRVYETANKKTELYDVWNETYERRFCGDVLFRDDSQAYNIGVKPLRKKDLKDFGENDKIVNRFEEILRHNNVSDKENAFNRLIALFICKLVDEIQKEADDIVDFQYKIGTDTYESLQDRLQKLHAEGMEKFMREKIYYIADDYAEKVVQQYTGKKRQKLIEEIQSKIRILKFYTNNDFAFKEVHNEELFYQNGKILVEVVQLFENFRIIGSDNLQLLGDLFEQLLNKGFKQNEGQFFTPTPITRFIWDSLPLESMIKSNGKMEVPRVIDYACGAGHFLTEGFEAISDILSKSEEFDSNSQWVEKKIFGIEKDYRLARVSKISMFMHGAGDGNIVFGDGLENYPDKNIDEKSFDILVANPPYAVSAFKPHLNIKNNELSLLSKISDSGSEIETLFVERIAQLLKPKGIAAVVLPSSILNKESESFIAAREILLTNFQIKSIISLGGKTFGATGQNTIVLFLKKYDEPPKRQDLITDSVTAIFRAEKLEDWEDNEILREYLDKIDVTENDYIDFISRCKDISEWETHDYFSMYANAFLISTEYANKIKQKTFSKLSDAEKQEWINHHFYEFAEKCEKEKVFYFALIYKQKVMVLTAPSENKEQERFLGYKWSNRKGQEGIKILNIGGLLYDNNSRDGHDNVAELVRNSFIDEQINAPSLQEYYSYLKLKDMIDFSKVQFNKTIRTVKIRNKKAKDGYSVYKLSSKDFNLSIGNRVTQTEVEDSGKPIISANVNEIFGYTSKTNIKDFSKPSVLWGIDGDWMVNTIEENKEFYPTDHCGVIRCTNKDIDYKYLALAVDYEGQCEGFSRNYRASTQRIRDLSILVPSKNEQKAIIDIFDDYDKRIVKYQNDIDNCQNEILKIYQDIIKGKKLNRSKMIKLCQFINGDRSSNYPSATDFVEAGIPFINTGHINNGVVDMQGMNYIDTARYDLLSSGKINKGDIIFCLRGTLGKHAIVPDTKGAIASSLVILRPYENVILPEVLDTVLYTESIVNQVFTAGNNSSPPNLAANDVKEFLADIPDMTVQKEFVKRVAKIYDTRKIALEGLKELKVERNNKAKEYFD